VSTVASSVAGPCALLVEELTVTYGSSRGVEAITLEVPAGQVTGLLGPNGAGKTTLLRVALDLVHPTSGSVRILDTDSTDPRARERVTYLPGDLLLPGRLSGWSALRRYTAARGGLDRDRVVELADRLDLDLDRPVGQLSKGNRQKIGLVLAFAPESALLLLDEPTSGLDPLLQREFAALLRESVADGAAVVLSSHVLSELEGLADRVAVLRDGLLVAVETIADLRARAAATVRIRFATGEQANAFASQVVAQRVDQHGEWVNVAFTGDIDPFDKLTQLRPILVTRGISIEVIKAGATKCVGPSLSPTEPLGFKCSLELFDKVRIAPVGIIPIFGQVV
jgi:ABC-2 type transport system ATP-binding protein